MACAREQSCAADDMVDERRYEKARMNGNRHASSTTIALSRALRQRERTLRAAATGVPHDGSVAAMRRDTDRRNATNRRNPTFARACANAATVWLR